MSGEKKIQGLKLEAKEESQWRLEIRMPLFLMREETHREPEESEVKL